MANLLITLGDVTRASICRLSMINRAYLNLRIKEWLSRRGASYTWLRRGRALSRYLLKRPHDPDFGAFGSLAGDGLFLDIGASVGQSALSFRIFNRASPILSLEPLSEHAGDLSFTGRVITDFNFRILGAGREAGIQTLYVPYLREYALPAESSLDRTKTSAALDRLVSLGFQPSELSIREEAITIVRIDDLDLDPAFVKIDVEGSEDQVLEGMEATIARSRPYIMIEHSESSTAALERLASVGYKPFVLEHSAESLQPYASQDCSNIFLVPSEHDLQ